MAAKSNQPSSTTAKNAVAYINGCVYTIDKSKPWAEAFIVSPDGVFSSIGTNSDILSTAKRDGLITQDLRNQFIMPGIHDAHMHVLWAGLARNSEAEAPLESGAKSIAEQVKQSACACHYAHVYGDWLVGNMFSNEDFPDGKPDRKYLDDTFPDTPVMVRLLSGACHSMFMNTAALKRAGYDIEHEPESQAARFFRREDGSLTGELSEMAMTKALLALPTPTLAHVKRTLKNAIAVAHRAGVTSCQEASANTVMMYALRELDREGALNMQFYTHIVHGPEWLGGEPKENLKALIDVAEEFKSKHVDTRFVKIILDGVPLPPHFTHCGLDEHGRAEQSKICVEDFADAIEKYDERGLTVKIHCVGHGSTRITMDAIEATRKKNPDGPRHEIAHCSGVHDDEYNRFAPLRVTAEMSPAMFFTHPATLASKGLMDWNFTKMQKAGAHMTIGSDWGVPPDPSLLPAMEGIVESVGGGSKERGGEVLCRILTLAGAEAVGKEKETGSIEVGKKANFIAVDRDLSKGEFGEATVMKTWFEGEMVWDKENA